MKFERTQMHFAKDFFAAFAIVRSPYCRSAVAEVSVFNRSLFSLPLNCISLEFIYFFYQLCYDWKAWWPRWSCYDGAAQRN